MRIPQSEALRGEVHRLSRSIHRLSSLIRIEEPHRDKKETTKADEEDEGEGHQTTAGRDKPKRK